MAEGLYQQDVNTTNILSELFYKPFTSLLELASVKVADSILKERLPDTILDGDPELKEKCLGMMRIMRFDLNNLYEKCRILHFKDYKNIIWTPSGLVDVIKTFRYVKPKMEPCMVFNVACHFCLYEDVLEIAPSIDIVKYEKEDILASRGTDIKLFKYFKDRLEGGVPTANDISKLICHSIEYKYYYPVLHLWQELPDEHKSRIVRFYIKTAITYRFLSQNIVNLFKFFFDKMNEKEREELFKHQPVNVLYCFWAIYPHDHLMHIIRFFIRKKYLTYEQAIMLCCKFTKCRCIIFNSFCKHVELCPDHNLRFAHFLFDLVFNQMEYFGEELSVYPKQISVLLQEILFYTRFEADYLELILKSGLFHQLVLKMSKGENRDMKDIYIRLIENWDPAEGKRFLWTVYLKIKNMIQ